MSNPIGHTFMYNIIIVFLVIVFAFLIGVMSYYKAFKINNRIVYAIEKWEGYNDKSIAEIERILNNFGYDTDMRGLNCAEEYKGMDLITKTNNQSHRFCIYVDQIVNTDPYHASGYYYSYGVRTYMTIDLPVINKLRIPIFTKTNQIYKFTKKQQITY